MKKAWIILTALLVSVPLLGTSALRTLETPEEPDYLIISTYNPAPGRSFNEAAAEVSEWVRAVRSRDEIKSVRLFVHGWGPEMAFYLLVEPRDWAAIPVFQEAIFEAVPDILDQPWNWSAHGDHILTEIPVN